MAATLEEELAQPCLDNVDDYFSLAEEEAVFHDLEQEAKHETSPVELKQLPPGPQYVFLNGDHETPVINSDNVIPGFYAKTEYSSYARPRIKCSIHMAKSAHR
jgi:hypothetical protein